jgi:hypothetical protein
MSFASTLASTLRTEGYSATFFSSPANALAAARSKAPDLIKSKARLIVQPFYRETHLSQCASKGRPKLDLNVSLSLTMIES